MHKTHQCVGLGEQLRVGASGVELAHGRWHVLGRVGSQRVHPLVDLAVSRRVEGIDLAVAVGVERIGFAVARGVHGIDLAVTVSVEGVAQAVTCDIEAVDLACANRRVGAGFRPRSLLP